MSNEAIAHVSWYVLGYILNYENFVVQLLSNNQHPRLPGTEFCKNPVKAADEHYF
ncbi:hypothetical protein [Candidatus Sodalis sp. SoCistrobi]|uniref:hypothetical protein n=1 Tax=Candidatus Sodalis sp. SoCistrobi TaxID=1922216 RepID=UPI0015766CD3|nr:hypothetical protein [Candidatus Sodalis sp. SoCistrobi]